MTDKASVSFSEPVVMKQGGRLKPERANSNKLSFRQRTGIHENRCEVEITNGFGGPLKSGALETFKTIWETGDFPQGSPQTAALV